MMRRSNVNHDFIDCRQYARFWDFRSKTENNSTYSSISFFVFSKRSTLATYISTPDRYFSFGNKWLQGVMMDVSRR